MVQVLDCTLRDGGYVNNWEFDLQTSLSIIDGLYASGVRWIEIGIMGLNPKVGKQTKFSDFEQIKPFLINRKSDCHYAVMVTTALSDNFQYPKCSESTPDTIRVAYFKPELDKTLVLAEKLKQLGYKVFLQAMATFMYSDTELKDMLLQVNRLMPTSFYMVDSFSTMYPKDVAKMRDMVLDVLNENILFGFHAHNNIQMAYSNVQEFINLDDSRALMVDGSIFGMGRGAGNVPIELLMEFMNKKHGQNFDTTAVLSLYQNYLESIYKEYGWGYSAPYYLTAVNALNSVWGWFFMSKGITDIEKLEKAFKMIPDQFTYTLNKDIGNEIADKIRNM